MTNAHKITIAETDELPEAFDLRSGSWLERRVFNQRPLLLALCLVISMVLGWQATQLGLNASFEKMIPTGHPYITNFIENRSSLAGLGNSLRVAVAVKEGTIYDQQYLQTLQKINDELYLMPGVDRPYMKSLWTPSTRWIAVTEEGMDGGTVIPGDFTGSGDGSEASLEQIRLNVQRSGEIGQLVSANFRSSIVYVPLLDSDPRTGAALDYGELSRQLEQLRAKYQGDNIEIHITGFAKIVGDLIEGMQQVLGFFVLAVVIATAVLFAYTHCLRSSLLVMGCSLVGVLWQLGMLALLGFDLNPYSILVPFLVFAIGISHGAQKMNGIMRDIGSGMTSYVAARHTFRRLFRTGMAALVTDAFGFAVLLVIDIGVIRELAIAASLGVAVLIVSNLVMLPVLLSYIGVTSKAAQRAVRHDTGGREENVLPGRVWRFFALFTERKWALAALGVAAGLVVFGSVLGSRLQIGDLDPGAPELRADSRYNLDTAFMAENYAASSDIFVVMVKTGVDSCTHYSVLSRVQELTTELESLPGVESTNSMARLSRYAMVGYNEGNFKWLELIPNNAALGAVQARAPRELFNSDCSLLSIYVYLKDHKADTLTSVVEVAEAFALRHSDNEAQFVLAAGNAGIEAATNIVVKKAMNQMMYLVYAAVIILCWITFRTWRGVVVAVLPLLLTSIMCQALMVLLGIGVKVAILPVIALGVGIGVDYALYVLSVLLTGLRSGMTVAQAYQLALRQTGRIVMLTGATLAVGVATWVFSPIRFQADMGILLAFMFLFNMLGALILLPALAHFLLAPTRRAQPDDSSAAVQEQNGTQQDVKLNQRLTEEHSHA